MIHSEIQRMRNGEYIMKFVYWLSQKGPEFAVNADYEDALNQLYYMHDLQLIQLEKKFAASQSSLDNSPSKDTIQLINHLKDGNS